MFAKLLTGLSKIGKIVSTVAMIVDIIRGVLEAAKANGYQFPGRVATA